MRTALFLFNHDAPHQVAHLAGTAAAFARLYPQHRTVIAYATPSIRRAIGQIAPAPDLAAAQWHELALPGWTRPVTALDSLVPASRVLRLRHHADLFARADAVISTERTCLKVRPFIDPRDMPMFIRIPHGAGDRNVTYHPDYRQFDRILLAGEKAVQHMMTVGVARDRLRIVGYPKFDAVDRSPRPRLFGNDRPTFVYNPHFDPHLSSWYDAGSALLEWFASSEGQDYNCVFAPHVMLFRKRLHISPEYRTARLRPDVPRAAMRADNILVDLDGPRLFDMTYTQGADAYIGDASSQLYEFLLRPRPVFLLDPNGALASEGEATLPFLSAGPRFAGVDELIQAIRASRDLQNNFAQAQKTLFDHTFSVTDTPAPERAAAAIADALAGARG